MISIKFRDPATSATSNLVAISLLVSSKTNFKSVIPNARAFTSGRRDLSGTMTAQEPTMEHDLQNTIAILTRTPATLNALLRDLPEALTLSNEGGETFSPFDVVGHLIHGERTDWMVRAHRILEFGESRPFDPFDRHGQERENQGKSLPLLLDEFTRLRSENLADLRSLNLQKEDLAKRGRHPALGVVTLSELLATWAAHDLTHLHQISRVLANQYRDAVGPWSKYLGVMHCNGHGA